MVVLVDVVWWLLCCYGYYFNSGFICFAVLIAAFGWYFTFLFVLRLFCLCFCLLCIAGCFNSVGSYRCW